MLVANLTWNFNGNHVQSNLKMSNYMHCKNQSFNHVHPSSSTNVMYPSTLMTLQGKCFGSMLLQNSQSCQCEVCNTPHIPCCSSVTNGIKEITISSINLTYPKHNIKRNALGETIYAITNHENPKINILFEMLLIPLKQLVQSVVPYIRFLNP